MTGLCRLCTYCYEKENNLNILGLSHYKFSNKSWFSKYSVRFARKIKGLGNDPTHNCVQLYNIQLVIQISQLKFWILIKCINSTANFTFFLPKLFCNRENKSCIEKNMVVCMYWLKWLGSPHPSLQSPCVLTSISAVNQTTAAAEPFDPTLHSIRALTSLDFTSPTHAQTHTHTRTYTQMACNL